MRKCWVLIAVLNFLIAACFGVLLRAAFVWEIAWMDYRNVLHGHSHVALLGWLYLGFFLLIHATLLPKKKAGKSLYTWIFWLTQVSVTGMMLAFPMQGYAGFSIFFTTLHLLVSYLMVFSVWRDHDRTDIRVSLLLKTALLFLVFSTLGVWLLAVLMATGGKSGILYQVAIQFYLHFQFNGWLLFILLALVAKRVPMEVFANYFPPVFLILVFSQFLTFGLVIFWAYGSYLGYLGHALGAAMQLLAGALIVYRSLRARTPVSLHHPGWAFAMVALLVALIRVLFEILLVVPSLAEMAVLVRPLIIGFIHLNMLGLFSAYLLFAMHPGEKAEKTGPWLYVSLLFFCLGLLGSEAYLFLQGLYYWMEWGRLTWFYESLLVNAFFLSLGIVTYLVDLFSKFYFHTRIRYIYLSKKDIHTRKSEN